MLSDQVPSLIAVSRLDDVVPVRFNGCLHQHAHARFVVCNEYGSPALRRGGRIAAQGCTFRDSRAAATYSAASFAAPECFFRTATTPALRRARVSVAWSSLIVTTTTGTLLLCHVRSRARKSSPLPPGSIRSSTTAREPV